MPSSEFDVHGNLQPYTVITLTIEEFKQAFVTGFPDLERWLQDFGTSLAGRKKGIVQLNF